MPSLKQLSAQKDLFASGHRACAGCAASVIFRQIALVAGKNTVFVGATGCMEVVSTIFPYTAWKVPFLHNAFENSAATGSGIEATYRSLKKRGQITRRQRSALAPKAQPYQGLIDRLLFAMAGLSEDESKGLEERLEKML